MKRGHTSRHRTSAYRASTASFAVVTLTPVGTPFAAGNETSVAHVPFDFFAGEMMLRAGAYALGPSNKAGMRTFGRADDPTPKILIQVIHLPVRENAAPSRLLFYCQRDLYFLAQVLADPA